MGISVGTKLGPYDILAPLGSGGMGEVWRAVDTRLGREAALKLLPHTAADDPESLVRFRREAQLLATLSHPHIASIHSFEAIGDTHVIAMELVDGRTLQEMLAEGPLPVPEALGIARQIAEALAAAHASGILHRDLKPANVKVTSKRSVKLLDFGLAKIFAAKAGTVDLSGSPTIDSGNTREGTVLGTFSYMSPEQTRGRTLDARSDVWSFGCVLYETLTAKKAFPGDTMSDIFAGILHKEPDWALLPKETPRPAVLLLKECLTKPLEKRAPDMPHVLERLAEALRPPRAADKLVGLFTKRMLAAAGVAAALALGVLVARQASRPRAGRALPASMMLAVLPATDLTGRPDGRVLCDGLSASLRVKLQRVRGVEVVAASSPDVSRNADPAAWVRDTGANVLVQPVLRSAGERMQLAFTLTRPGSPVQIGADEVTGPAGEPFRLEEELADRLLAALGKPAAAATKEEALSSEAQTSLVLASGYLERWDDAASIAKAVDLLTTLPGARGSALVQATLGGAYLRAYELSSETSQALMAKQAAERAIELSPDLPDALVTLGRLLAATGQAEQALAPIRKAQGMRPESADVATALAWTLHVAGKPAEAEAAFRRSIALRPAWWVPYNQLATFYVRRDRAAEAAEMYAKAAALNPQAPTVAYNLGAALYRLGRLEEAEAAFLRSIAIRKTSVAYSNLGTLQYGNGRYADAVGSFGEAVKLTPDDAALWMNLGDGLRRVPERAAEAADAYERAIPLARAALSVDPKAADVHATLAVALARTGRGAAAAEEARLALKVPPSDPSVFLMTALVARLEGKNADAVALLEKGVASGLSAQEIETEPDFEALRKDPRIAVLLAKARSEKEK